MPDPETKEKPTGASAIAARIAELRGKMATGETIIPKAGGDEDADAEKPDAGDESRAEAGDEAKGGDEQQEAEATGEEKDGETGAEKSAETEVEEEKKEEAEGAAAEEGAEAAAEEEAEEEEEEVDPELIVSLSPRREGDPEVEVVMPDKATAERVRQLQNAAMAGEEVRVARGRIAEDQAEIDEMETAISTDPVGFIVDNVPPETVEQVALALITSPDVFAKVRDTLATLLEDPGELRVVQAEMKAARMTSKDQLRTIAEHKKTSRETARKIVEGIELMVPQADGITETRHATIIADVRRHVADAVKTQQLTALDPKDLPLLAAPALRQHGIDPLKAAEVLNQALKRGGVPAGDSPPAPPAKTKSGKDFKQARSKKKRVAASVPAGGGAPAARPSLPKGQRVEDRIKLAREKGLGALLRR